MKRILLTCAVVTLLALVATGCVRILQHDSSYTPALAGDGQGSAVVVFAESGKGGLTDFVAQKVGPTGERQWGGNGVLLGSGYRSLPSFRDLTVVDDSHGEALVGWKAQASESGPLVGHVAKLASGGTLLWQRELAAFDQLVADGIGGAILIYDHAIAANVTGPDESRFAVVRLDAQGEYAWGESGVDVSRANYWPNSLRVSHDGRGGAIALWEESRSVSAPTVSRFKTESRIVAQRIDAAGGLPWGPQGILVSENAEGVRIEEPALATDGNGGVIVAWQRVPQGPVTSGTPEALRLDILVQKLDANGRILWQPDGVPLDISRSAENAGPHTPVLVSDGALGAIAVWEDLRNGLASIYAQRVDDSGSPMWQTGGVKACYVPSPASLAFRQVTGDGRGGAVVSAAFTGGVLVQKLDAGGNATWGDNGVVVTSMSTTSHLSSTDGQGGAIVAWGAGNSSYVQRIGADGRLAGWEGNGIRLDRLIDA